MLKELPKLLDRDFLIGFFLPAALFSAIVLWVLAPVPAVQSALELLSKDTTAAFVVSFIAVGALAIHLLIANRGMIRFLEGYYFPLNKLWLPRAWQRFRYKSRQHKLADLERNWTKIKEDCRKLQRARQQRNKFLRDLAVLFPDQERHILPTRLGNIIRSFEVYPSRMYGVDAIPMWSRMTPILPEELSRQINGAKSILDYFINATFLSLALCAAKIFRIEWGHSQQTALNLVDFTLSRRSYYIPIILFISLAFIFYRAACSAALGWGNTVKAAFDLYLDDCAKQLGYEPPLSADVWGQISGALLYLEALPPRVSTAKRKLRLIIPPQYE